MRYAPLTIAFVLVALSPCGAAPAPDALKMVPAPTPVPPPAEIRSAVIAKALSYVGTREKTGHNDGPVIEKWLMWVGAHRGDPWCAAFVYGIGREAGFPKLYPPSAWSPDTVRGGKLIRDGAKAQPADAFGIYFASKGRVAHTGIVERDKGDVILTIEGNSNDAGSREGDGVYRKKRLRRQIYIVRDWTQ